MRIKKMFIGDFGIFRNQNMEDLHTGLNIIGGMNRAGKSTLLQVLKHLGYGIPSGGNIPPANIEYNVEADLLDEETNRLYHVRLQGHSQPVCTYAENGESVPISRLYSLDSFTYHNLFTISLNQLTPAPEGFSKKELEKLQAVLLGAGLSDIANIPGLENSFQRAAASIGGTTGRLTNKGFRTYVERIEEGIERRQKALSQVEEYELQQKNLSRLQKQEQELRAEIKELQSQINLLEALKENYDILEELSELETHLELSKREQAEKGSLPSHLLKNRPMVEAALQDYGDKLSQWEEEHNILDGSLGSEAKRILPLLLEYRSELTKYHDRLSGIEAKINILDNMEKEIEEDKRQLLERMKRLHSGWTEEDLDRIRNLNPELIMENRLMEAQSNYKSLNDRLQRTNDQLKENQGKAEMLETQMKEWKKDTFGFGMKAYLRASIVFILLGIAVSLFQPFIGILLGFAGIGGSVIYVIMKRWSQREADNRLRDLQGELSGLLSQKEELENARNELLTAIGETEKELSDIKAKLHLEMIPGYQNLLDYYRGLTDIKEKIDSLDRQKERWTEEHTLLSAELREIADLLAKFDKTEIEKADNDKDKPALKEIWPEIQLNIKQKYSQMETAIQLNRLSDAIIRTESRLMELIGEKKDSSIIEKDVTKAKCLSFLERCDLLSDYLNKEEKRKAIIQGLDRAVKSQRLAESLSNTGLEGFRRKFMEYPGLESIVREHTALVNQLHDRQDALENCRNTMEKTKLSLEQLSLTEELEQAHELIYKGRSDLFQEAYRYGVYKTAAWLSREIRNRFLEKTKDELLLKADNIIQRLTHGQYLRILPKEDLSDFSFARQDGAIQESSNVLSRGTREQVYLAVRLGRILDISPCLPVLIDDSFVNFDSAHLQEAAALLCELSRTHQIFLMTCHPHLVELFTDLDEEIRYWHLENGRFSSCEGRDLMRALHFSGSAC